MRVQRALIFQIAVLSLPCREVYLLIARLVLQADQLMVDQALLFLRGMVGVGLGGAHVPVALYLEFVPTNLRGVMLVALQSFWTIGTMIEVPAHCPSSKFSGFTPHASRQWKRIFPTYSNAAIAQPCKQAVLQIHRLS